ncbi:MAG: hypothetical protein ACLSB9_13440 [Hydrogeniiclostridium mannosilyticum]
MHGGLSRLSRPVETKGLATAIVDEGGCARPRQRREAIRYIWRLSVGYEPGKDLYWQTRRRE